MKKEIEDLILEDLKQGIQDLLDGKIEEYGNKYLWPDIVIGEFEKHGFEEDENKIDSNGWEYDNWHYMKKDNVEYCISGSGYYGGIRISKSKQIANSRNNSI